MECYICGRKCKHEELEWVYMSVGLQTNRFPICLKECTFRLNNEKYNIVFKKGKMRKNRMLIIFDFDGTIGDLKADWERENRQLAEIEASKTFKPFKQVVKFIKEMHDMGNTMVILSNNYGTSIEISLDNNGLLKYFKEIVGKDVGYIKPNPNNTYYLMGKYREDKVLFIGNSDIDEETAKNAGIDFKNVKEILESGQ